MFCWFRLKNSKMLFGAYILNFSKYFSYVGYFFSKNFFTFFWLILSQSAFTCPKLWRHSAVFIVNFEHISHLILVNADWDVKTTEKRIRFLHLFYSNIFEILYSERKAYFPCDIISMLHLTFHKLRVIF